MHTQNCPQHVSTPTKNKKSNLGHEGETHVATMLTKNGFTLIERNYSLRCGEIDLICRKGSLLIFVEVKTRSCQHKDFDLTTVITPAKQRKIIKTALIYLTQHRLDDCACRFDVALIDQFSSHQITYIADAFRNTSY